MRHLRIVVVVPMVAVAVVHDRRPGRGLIGNLCVIACHSYFLLPFVLPFFSGSLRPLVARSHSATFDLPPRAFSPVELCAHLRCAFDSYGITYPQTYLTNHSIQTTDLAWRGREY